MTIWSSRPHTLELDGVLLSACFMEGAGVGLSGLQRLSGRIPLHFAAPVADRCGIATTALAGVPLIWPTSALVDRLCRMHDGYGVFYSY